MDSPIKDRVTASVALKNKYAAFCSDDEGDASRIVDTDQIKKGEKTSVKKVPRNATTSTSSATKKLPNPEKSQTVTANKEDAQGRGREGARDENRRASTRGNGREGIRGNGREGIRGNGREGIRGNGREGIRGNGREGIRGSGRGGIHGQRREPRKEGELENNGNGRRPQQQDGEVGHVREDDEKLNVDRRPNRGDRGNRRPYRGGAGRGGGGRSDRTGVHDAPKKDGYGKGNWGTEKDELQGETEPTGETNVVKPTEEDNAEKNDSGVELEKEEEKPVGMTLQEWKEKNKAIEPETFNVRKPNDDKKLNLAPLKKSEDENKENDEFVVLRREPREKHVDISVNFASTTDRGVGGNRDGFRGRGGDRQDRERGDRQTRATKGGQRGDRNRGSNNSQFNLLNDQFPVLGGH